MAPVYHGGCWKATAIELQFLRRSATLDARVVGAVTKLSAGVSPRVVPETYDRSGRSRLFLFDLPPMADRPKIVSFIIELRKSIRLVAATIGLTTLAVFFLSPRLLQFVQHHLATKLYFFSVAGPFLAHVTLAFFIALLALMPWLTIVLWRAMGKVFNVSNKQVFFFVLCTCLLFYAGIAFCYFVTLPFGISFLLGFGSEELRPVISVNQFVIFVAVFISAFGCIFQLPILMVFFARIGLLSRRFYERNRRYALLAMAIVSAILTPTPDIVNMALMGGPLYFLYEAGIVIIRLFGIGKAETVTASSKLEQG